MTKSLEFSGTFRADPNIISAIRPVPHSTELPIPDPPEVLNLEGNGDSEFYVFHDN